MPFIVYYFIEEVTRVERVSQVSETCRLSQLSYTSINTIYFLKYMPVPLLAAAPQCFHHLLSFDEVVLN